MMHCIVVKSFIFVLVLLYSNPGLSQFLFSFQITELTLNNYVEEIENEKRFVTIVIHVYDKNVPACVAMSGCLQV